MSAVREIKEGMQFVGVDERPIFRLNTARWGGSPTSPVTKAFEYDEETGGLTDKTSVVFPSGAASISGDFISLPTFISEAADMVYRVEVKFTTNGSELEAYAWVTVER